MSGERSAMNQALYYLGLQARTTRQVREYLAKKGHDEAVIDATLSKIIEYGYLNDEEFAQRFVRSQGTLRGGRRKLEGKLAQKGVDKETASSAVKELSDEEELLCAKEWIRKWEKQLEGISERQKRDKICRRLSARGFEWDVIQKAVRQSETIED